MNTIITGKHNYGYAFISNLLKGWSNEYKYAKLGQCNKVSTFLSNICPKLKNKWMNASYYFISTDKYFAKYDLIPVYPVPNPIKYICIIETDEFNYDIPFLQNGVEYIDGDIWYLIYKTHSDRDPMTDDRFSAFVLDMIDTVKHIISMDYTDKYDRKIIYSSSYSIYKAIYPMYCIFEWLYSIHSNTTYEIWSNIIREIIIDYISKIDSKEYMSITDEERKSLNQCICKVSDVIYDLLLYMSKNSCISIEEIIETIINSDLYKFLSKFGALIDIIIYNLPCNFNSACDSIIKENINFKIFHKDTIKIGVDKDDKK